MKLSAEDRQEIARETCGLSSWELPEVVYRGEAVPSLDDLEVPDDDADAAFHRAVLSVDRPPDYGEQ